MKKLPDEESKKPLRDIADIAPEEQWWLTPRSTTSLRYLDAVLQRLATAIDGADAAPTPDAREGWAKIRPIAEATLRAWSEFNQRASASQ
jgi:hypothetical protein